ncbi:ribosome biogenesis protein BMS1 homolog [Fopius arisanus]|uniref:Ribosome biogenesis protein BMS1 homolog n=1 Tax=Fopius arisanus TaxID=64838 RepID=A0A9R1SVX5_9HYME|nr:PREDICTED: ribosome biogenesis protein BMS1 homolog [Fopius arisanus]
MSAPEGDIKHKSHRERNAGRKAEKKKSKKPQADGLTDKQRNPKAFTFNSAVKAERRFRRKQDIETKKQHIPVVDRTPVEPPPILVAVVGPPKVGKSLLIQCLIKSYVRQPLSNVIGPVTIVSGKKRRITFMECNNDINSMIDIAKVADLVLLLVDASFGFEMEIFEFLNICQVHGMPRIMGVLTHLDLLTNAKQLKKTKKILKHRFWTEVYQGAKLFYLSGLLHEEYLRNEVKNLSRFISVMKFRPLVWRTTHPYLLVDRVEDLTSPEAVRQNPKVDRMISLYGYVRGVPLNKESSIHIPGCGDLRIKDVSFLPDPCPLPEHIKKRALVEKERLIYAPFSGVGGIVYDKDAVYVELGGSHSHKEEDTGLISSLMDAQGTLDEKLEKSELQLFSGADFIKSGEVEEEMGSGYGQENVVDGGRIRRKVIFRGKIDDEDDEDGGEDEDDEEDDGIDDEDVEEDEIDEEPVETQEESIRHDKAGGKRKTTASAVEGLLKKQKIDEQDELELELASLRAQDVPVTPEFNPETSIIHRPLSRNPTSEVKDKITEALSKFSSISHQIKSKKHSESESDTDESYDELSDNDIDGKSNLDDLDGSDESVLGGEVDENAEGVEDEEDEEDLNDETPQWKSDLAKKARESFLNRQQCNVNLMKLVYGVADSKKSQTPQGNEENDDEENVGGIFRVVSEKQKQKLEERELKNQEETMYYSREPPRDWVSEENKLCLVNRFVTGKWKESEDAEELLKLDDLEDDEEEVFGDFEDLETGEKVQAKDSSKPPKELIPDEADEKKKLLEKKRKLKQQFDSEYDNAETKSYYDDLKQEVEKQAQLNKSEFEGLDDDLRVQLEGFRPGMYVRVELESVPCELITNLDPTYPLIVGGLLHGEENIGYVQGRLKKHRWYSKILKTRDPLILSVGWRRFQTLPIYSKLEDNLRNRMIKYTPEHVACMAHFWGPITPQGTGFLAVQDVSTRIPGFRIAATGTILELDKSTRIVKKLKLTGVPMKVYKKTAFIKDMFNSTLEVAKFEGARIKTVSGIRGMIKKAINKPEGCFRATFEDKIQLSDIVFCRTWYKIDVPKLYNPVNSLLLPLEQKNQWKGMKTTGQLKREENIRAVPNKDSLYTKIERQPKVFKPLVIPRNLQKELPYRDKPKLAPLEGNRRNKFGDRRVAVVRDVKEENVAKFMKMIRTNYANKQEKLKEATKARMSNYQKRVEAEESRKLKRQRELKKQVFRTLSKMEIKEKKKKESGR